MMDHLASSRFNVLTDPPLGKSLSHGRRLSTIVRSIASFFTEGLVRAEPKVRILVKDSTSGACVLEHSWSSTEAALRDFEAIRDRLQTLTVEEFLAEYAIEPPSPPP